MKAFRVVDFDKPAMFCEIPRQQPQHGQVEVKIEACGLNFADLLMQKNQYQDTPRLPFTMGLELSGKITSIGPNTKSPEIGTRVTVFSGQGGLAEYGYFPVERLVRIPEKMPSEIAAGFQIAYGTSHVALKHCANLNKNNTLLVLGAAGGVGLTAVELGKYFGAYVIAAARGREKLKIAEKFGADILIDTSKENLREVVKSVGGADVVYDPVGGDLFKEAMRACKPEGKILTIGFASGDIPFIAANHLLVKNLSVIGLNWGAYVKFNPKVISKSLADLMEMFTQNKLAPHISHLYPFSETKAALELIKNRKSTGKVVVTI